MSRHGPPTRTPCPVCTVFIDGWTADGRMIPCGHGLDDAWAVWRESNAQRVPAITEPKEE